MRISILLAFLCLQIFALAFKYPETPIKPVVDDYHGIKITDNYRWLEDIQNPGVRHWINEQEKVTRSFLDRIPQAGFIRESLEQLMRYDDISLPERVPGSERVFYTVKKKDMEHEFLCTRADENSGEKILIDPNKWDNSETLSYWKPSRDGQYLAFGKSRGGDESPVLYIMNTQTGKILPDALQGWRQRISDWMPDSSGFYYIANPERGSVPVGEEYYWQSVYSHKLGTQKEKDKKIWYSNDSKEMFHYIFFSEDGKYEILIKGIFYGNEIYIRPAGSKNEPLPVATGFDSQYSCSIYDDVLYIHTDFEAPNKTVYKADPDSPSRENWTPFIPETGVPLSAFDGIGGVFYASYLEKGYTRIMAYNTLGKILNEIPLPAIGTASISGFWKDRRARVSFSSFAFPQTFYSYDIENNALEILKKPREIYNTKGIITEQVTYESRDKTEVPMFLVYREGMKKNSENPVLLSGYGGFNISVRPRFRDIYYLLLEADMVIALPMLRGGGDFGKEWHESGMLDKKQNVFDDFICAAEWLINNNYTNPKKIAIQGGSNGGLLMGAVTVQRPSLFRAVLCQVPLLDMLRYHLFDYANIWAREYGSSDSPAQFKYLLEYSPYHNIRGKTPYPAVLFSASENDARTAPLHAMKMTAALQKANISENPILLMLNRDSGHGGGTTITDNIEQTAMEYGFLLYHIGAGYSGESKGL